MLEYLRAMCIAVARCIIGFFQQRKVDMRLDITHQAGITVPIPRAAEVPALVDDADARKSGFTQPSARQQTAKTAPRYNDLNVVMKRGAG